MSQPQVSIILPTRNRAYVLRQTLDGIRAQTLSAWELIVIDDGSTDGTRELVASYADPRFRYFRNESPLGAAKARNLGLAQARGEYIAFQDAGEDWRPEKLALQVERLRSLPAEVAMVYTPLLDIYLDGTRKALSSPTFRPGDADTFHRALGLEIMGIDLPSCLFRASALKACGGFDESLERWIDLELIMRLARTSRFDRVEGFLTLCFQRPEGIAMNVDALVAAHEHILAKYAEDLAPEHLTAHRRIVGRRLLGSERWAPKGRGMLLQVLRAPDSTARDWLWFAFALGGPRLHRFVRSLRNLLRRLCPRALGGF